MPKVSIQQLDAFTNQPFTGNPAAVVSRADGLSPTEMQAIAREMNVSETVFVLSATDPDADLQIRWFTPTTEVDLCGHATIACFHALARQGMYGLGGDGVHSVQVQTRSGTLPVQVEHGEDGRVLVWFGLPVPVIRPCRLDREVLAELLGIHPGAFDADLPLAEFYRYAAIPVRDLPTLKRLHPDAHGLAQLSAETGVGGFAPLTLETVHADSALHIRFFAPSEGLIEDPVTGSAHGPLGVYLWRQGVLAARDGVIRCVGEQGDGLGRPGRVSVRIRVEGDEVRKVEVGGEAVLVLEGDLELGA
jgi:PhzF family phenazine biosynthesis protein